jgi:hypothetical protein
MFGAHLRAGDWVEVKSKQEILATLDKQGRLDGLPFMPEMFEYCGQRVRVSKRAHKTCDPPSGLAARKMESAVHLDDLRCDGQAHGGCQAGCLLFWKEAWVKPVNAESAHETSAPAASGCTETDVHAGTVRKHKTGADVAYVCQSTQLFQATGALAWWDLRQYVEDYVSGNVRLHQFFAAMLFTLYSVMEGAGVGFGAPMRWVYDRFQQLRGGAVYPKRRGRIPLGQPTPANTLNLSPGEAVRVKSIDEILGTLNRENFNRGLFFDYEYVAFCGKTYRVLRRVERIINEKTGALVKLKSDAIILEGVACEARYAECRRFCPRAIYPYWREIWLERVDSSL